LQALRDAIRANLSAREEHERRMAHEEEVVNTVVEQATIDPPPQMVEEEAGRHVQQLAQNLERQGIPLQSYLRFTQKTEEQFRAEMMAQAERTVRRSEVLNAIALAEGIEVSDDEIREQLTVGLEDTNENRRLIRESMQRPAVKEQFAASIRRERAIRMLLETVGGVDFAALEAEAAAASTVVDAVDEAVDDEELDEVEGQMAVAEQAIEAYAEARGVSVEEAAHTLVAAAAAQLETELEEGTIDSDEKPAPATGDTSA
jgi:trigger factor